MSLKRKRTSQGKAAPPPPEPPKSPSPPPWNLPFPRLPTVDQSPPPQEAELKGVADSGVLATALLQSRELWVHGYHFPKVWKPTRRTKKDPPPAFQYVTTRLGICPVVIGPHIFPDTRFLSVRKVDEEAEKAEKAAKAAKATKPRVAAPIPTPTQTTSSSNALTVKALTEIAATSPEFSAILQAVANRTATQEQHAALAQYMRAASLFGTSKSSLSTPAVPATPTQATTTTQVPSVSQTPSTVPNPVTPVPTVSKTPVTTIPAITTAATSTQKPPLLAAPIPPVPKSSPAPVPPVTPRVITPVTRIPPPTGNINPIPAPNVPRPITTPVTRIPPPSAPITPAPATSATPATVSQPANSQPVTSTPVTPAQNATAPLVGTPTPQQPAPLSPAVDPMNFVEIGFELTEPGERLLIPRYTILEKFTSPQGGNNVLASFILTINDSKVYIPITLKLSDCPPRIWEALHKYVYPQPVVVKEMERIMKECKRFEKSVLQLRIPVEEEGYTWNGLKQEKERKKYTRRKKEEAEEGEDGNDDKKAVKKKKSLVVGLKYTPTKTEPAT